MGILAVDVSTFGVVMSADSQPVEALDHETRVVSQQGELTRCPIVIRRGGGFTGFTGYVGTEEIDGRTTRDWLTAFGAPHAGASLADYAAALGNELTAVWQGLGLKSVLEILISGVENGDVRFWFVRNSDGLYVDDWTYKPPKPVFEVVDDLDGRYRPGISGRVRRRKNFCASACTSSGRASCSRRRSCSTPSAGSWSCSTCRASTASSR